MPVDRWTWWKATESAKAQGCGYIVEYPQSLELFDSKPEAMAAVRRAEGKGETATLHYV